MAQTKIPGIKRIGNAYSKDDGTQQGMDPMLSQPVGTVIRPDASQPILGGRQVAGPAANYSLYLDNYNRPGMQGMGFNADGSFRSMDIKEGTPPSLPQYKGEFAYDRPMRQQITMDEAKGMQGFNYTQGEKKRAGYKQGGLVKGKGTATSDSIPAKLSKGEMVIPAAVVKHYGAAYFKKLMQSVNPELGTQTTVKKGVVHAAKSARYDINGILIPETTAPNDYAQGRQPAINQPAAQLNPDTNKTYSGKYPALADANSVQTERVPANDFYAKGATSANPDLTGSQNFTTQPNYEGTIPLNKSVGPVNQPAIDMDPYTGQAVKPVSPGLTKTGAIVGKVGNTVGELGKGLGIGEALQTGKRALYNAMPKGPVGNVLGAGGMALMGDSEGAKQMLFGQPVDNLSPLARGGADLLGIKKAAANTAIPSVTEKTPPTLAQPGAIQPAANKTQIKPGIMPSATADETQIPYAGAAGQKYISNPDGTNTTITNANRLSNRVEGGLPVTMASESIAANGDRNYVIPGENGNASRLGIHQTGTDARGNGNFDVSYGKGQKGTVSASPELMKRYRENKGSFGVADMSKVPHYEEAQQSPQPSQLGLQMPQPIDQPQAPDYSAQINELMAQMPVSSSSDDIDTMIAKKRQRKEIEVKLNALTGMQESGNRLASENARLGSSQNQYNQSRQDTQARDARDAQQQQWTNAKEANAVDYLHEKNKQDRQDAQDKAKLDEMVYQPGQRTIDELGQTTYTDAALINKRTGQLSNLGANKAQNVAPTIRYDKNGNAFTLDENGQAIPYKAKK